MIDKSSASSFREFVDSVAAARFDEFRATPGVRVESVEEFEKMRRHVLGLYQGVDSPHRFEVDGTLVDCIPIEQHPSVRRAGGKVLPPPPLPEFPEDYMPAGPGGSAFQPTKHGPPQLAADYKDRFGNQMWCPLGTVAMVRVTLERLVAFRTLQDFFKKERPESPSPKKFASGLPSSGTSSVSGLSLANKRYAIAFETVNNVGGSGYINVWKPFISPLQECYAQQWYTAKTADGSNLQTVECGWHIDVQRYGDSNPHLFVFATPDTYTTGCFNLDCGAFVPNSGSNVALGCSLAASQADGSQVDYLMGFFLTGGAWWFYFNGQWAGYYPLAFFQGDTMASSAQNVEFGGEAGTGFSLWPPMGSGQPAAAGFGRAAYHRQMQVTPVGGAARDVILTPSPSNTPCYSITVNTAAGPGWSNNLFYGGAGGSGC